MSPSRIVSEQEYQRLQATEWALWRGEISGRMAEIQRGLEAHVKDDKDAITEVKAAITSLSKRVDDLDGKLTMILSTAAAVVVLVNIVLGGIAVYVTWIKP